MHHLELQISQLQSAMQICLIAALKAWRSVGYHKQIQSKLSGHYNSLPLLSTRQLQHANVLHIPCNVVTS